MAGTGSLRSALGVLAVLGLLSFVAVDPPDDDAQAIVSADGTTAVVDQPGGDPTAPEGTAGPDATVVESGPAGPVTAGSTPTASGPSSSGSSLACRAGANGGATDVGVEAGKIKLAATNVRSGVGASFLGSAYIGLQAVVNRTNAEGGICGRLLELRLVDDGWDAPRGAAFIQNFIKEGYFALPVVPSSEGLTQAIVNKSISGAKIPVIGSDGMLKEQYNDQWVWPVATATVSTMRIMAKHARDGGAKTFGIVYDQRYKFGIEGAAAFKQYVKTLTGNDPDAFVGITPGRSDYASDAQAFNEACGSQGCDFVAMLLDPVTANTYISSQTDKEGRRQGFGRMLTGGAQPLFNERFARDCGRPCDGMLVWTGYNPPIGGLASQPDVAQYVSDVKSVDPSVDVNNQFLQGAYLGMRVFVHALEAAGPQLTRARVAEVMNSTTFRSDLSSPLTWKPGERFANTGAQAFRIVTAAGSFAGFAEAGTGFVPDPTPGVVPS